MAIVVKLMRWILYSVAALVGLYFVAALVMTFWPQPGFSTEWGTTDGTSVSAGAQANGPGAESVHFTARDGATLFARRFGEEAPVTVLLLHGVTSESSRFAATGETLHDLTGAQVIALDLRGHGNSEGKSGDVDYIGQYEDDVADVLAALRAQQPEGRVILAGHSMGGGVALRFALLEDAPSVDGYLLFAPHLGANSPTVPTPAAEGEESAGAEAAQSEPFLKLHIPRLLGLTMLNGVGIRPLNGLATMFFNLPPGFTSVYSYRAMINSSPAEYQPPLEAVDKPLLVLVGSNDEAFVAAQFPPTVTAHSDGEVIIFDGETHDGIYNNPSALAAAQAWMQANGFAVVTE